MTFLSDSQLLTIRGKVMVGHATRDELFSVFGHIDALEEKLDHIQDETLFLGEDWRKAFGVPGYEEAEA